MNFSRRFGGHASKFDCFMNSRFEHSCYCWQMVVVIRVNFLKTAEVPSMDPHALDLWKKIRDSVPYLEKRLEQIEANNQGRLLQQEVSDIKFWMTIAKEVRADMYGFEYIYFFLQIYPFVLGFK